MRRYYLSESIPRLRTFHAALDRYETTIPLRSGEKKGERPLGDRRRYIRSMIKKAEDNQSVQCVLWGSNLVTFFADGDIKFSSGGWDSPTTLGFLRDVYGEKCFTRKSGKIYFTTEDGAHYRLSKAGLRVRNGHPIDAKPESTVVLNLEKLRALRKQYAPFITYCTNLCKLTPSISHDDWQIIIKDKTEPIYHIKLDHWDHNKTVALEQHRHFFADVDKSIETKDWDLMYIRYLNIFHYYHRWVYHRDDIEHSRLLNVAQFKKVFDELLKFKFSDILFERKEAEQGIAFTDKNNKYLWT